MICIQFYQMNKFKLFQLPDIRKSMYVFGEKNCLSKIFKHKNLCIYVPIWLNFFIHHIGT